MKFKTNTAITDYLDLYYKVEKKKADKEAA